MQLKRSTRKENWASAPTKSRPRRRSKSQDRQHSEQQSILSCEGFKGLRHDIEKRREENVSVTRIMTAKQNNRESSGGAWSTLFRGACVPYATPIDMPVVGTSLRRAVLGGVHPQFRDKLRPARAFVPCAPCRAPMVS